MPDSLIARLRLTNQLVGRTVFATPGEVVGWMGFVQAQDYLGALWAVGLRLPVATEAGIEQALAAGEIVRTWPARGTLHLVAAADVRWILSLLAPRAIGRAAGRHRQLDLDDATFAGSRQAVSSALQGGRRLTRDALFRALEAAQISVAGQRGIHILGRLAQEGLICFGPREGKRHTFTLLEEWIPAATSKTRDEALAELAGRYFRSHGPAMLRDFVWWSGLTTADARSAVELAGPSLVEEMIAGESYWLSAAQAPAPQAVQDIHLLPAFDEILVGYRDRSAILDPASSRQINAGGGMLSPTIVANAQIAGVWKRSLKKESVVVTPSWFDEPSAAEQEGLAAAARRYGAFLGLPAVELATSLRR